MNTHAMAVRRTMQRKCMRKPAANHYSAQESPPAPLTPRYGAQYSTSARESHYTANDPWIAFSPLLSVLHCLATVQMHGDSVLYVVRTDRLHVRQAEISTSGHCATHYAHKVQQRRSKQVASSQFPYTCTVRSSLCSRPAALASTHTPLCTYCILTRACPPGQQHRYKGGPGQSHVPQPTPLFTVRMAQSHRTDACS